MKTEANSNPLDEMTIALFKFAGWAVALAAAGVWGHLRSILPFPSEELVLLTAPSASQWLWRPIMFLGGIGGAVCGGLGIIRIDTSWGSNQVDRVAKYFRPVRWVLLFGVLLEVTIWVNYLALR